MQNAVQIIESRRDALMTSLPDHIGRDRFYQIAVGVANSADLRDCAPSSVALAIWGCARLGLVPDPALGHVYVLPRYVKKLGGRVAQIQVGYRGYIELARRSRRIAAVHAEVVHANDQVQVHYGTNRRIEHRPWFDLSATEAGEPMYAYCTWLDVDSGSHEFRIAHKARIQRAMDTSESAGSDYSPWKRDPLAMWRKTACIEASKVWPLTAELAQAVQWDEQAERGEQVIDAPPTVAGAIEAGDEQLTLSDFNDEDADQPLSDEEKQTIIEREAQEAASHA